MAMTIVMSQSGLRYCLCLEKVFAGECECLEMVVFDECSFSKEELEPCAPSCADDCSVKISTEDCTVDFIFDIDVSVPSDVDGQSLVLQSVINIPTPSYHRSTNEIRGSPPALLVVSSVPIYVRHLVFLV